MAAYHNILSNKQSIKASAHGTQRRGRTVYGANYKQLDAMLPRPAPQHAEHPRPAAPARAHLVITLFIAYWKQKTDIPNGYYSFWMLDLIPEARLSGAPARLAAVPCRPLEPHVKSSTLL